jgi:hypothetical protein
MKTNFNKTTLLLLLAAGTVSAATGGPGYVGRVVGPGFQHAVTLKTIPAGATSRTPRGTYSVIDNTGSCTGVVLTFTIQENDGIISCTAPPKMERCCAGYSGAKLERIFKVAKL